MVSVDALEEFATQLLLQSSVFSRWALVVRTASQPLCKDLCCETSPLPKHMAFGLPPDYGGSPDLLGSLKISSRGMTEKRCKISRKLILSKVQSGFKEGGVSEAVAIKVKHE